MNVTPPAMSTTPTESRRRFNRLQAEILRQSRNGTCNQARKRRAWRNNPATRPAAHQR